jgi:hypothetical protein
MTQLFTKNLKLCPKILLNLHIDFKTKKYTVFLSIIRVCTHSKKKVVEYIYNFKTKAL